MLLLPKYYKEREDFVHYQKDEFYKKLEKFISDNAEDRPFFVTYKQAFDNNDLSKANEVFVQSFTRPQFIRNSMCFFVCPRVGFVTLLWRVSQDGQIKFNLKAADKLSKAIGAANR